MRIKPRLEISELPRMADFAAWGAAVAEALGIGADRFLAAYWRNIGQVNERILQSHPVAAAVVALLSETAEWQGTPAQLLEALEQVAEREKINVRAKTWPKSANALTRRLKEVASNLADADIEFEHLRVGHERTRTLKLAKISSAPSSSSGTRFHAASGADGNADDIEVGATISSAIPSAIPSALKARRDAGFDDPEGNADDADDNSTLLLGELALEDDDLPF
jgi:GNAT superfamily N-acetyltransferase